MTNEKVGKFIKTKRKEKNLTQKELACQLGISDKAISKWERGICCPDISLLKDLSSILGISVNELLSGENIYELEKEKTDVILLDTVNKYTSIEKRKNRKLLIFTCILLVFYLFFIIYMYFMFNQVNYTDGMTIETLQNKRIVNKLYTALENYDYDYLRKLQRLGTGYNWSIYEGQIEDENKCDYYLDLIEEGKIGPDDWGIVCRLKDFEENGIRFVNHEYFRHYYAGMGNFAVSYIIEIEYKEYLLTYTIESYIHNNVITYLALGTISRGDDDILENMKSYEFQTKYPLIYEKILMFFKIDEEIKYPKN